MTDKAVTGARGLDTSLLELILDAAVDDRAWVPVLEHLCRILQAHGALLEFRPPVPSKAVLLATHGVEARFRKHFLSLYAFRNPWVKLWGPKLKAGTILPGDRVLPRREFMRTDMFKNVLLPQKMHAMVGVILSNDSRGLATLWFLRARDAGPFRAREISKLKTFLPALQKAVGARQKMCEAEQFARAASEVLHRIPAGILLLDSRGKIFSMNRKARDILDRKDGLRKTADGLGAVSPKDSARLSNALDALQQCGEEISTGNPELLIIERRFKDEPLHLLLFPVRGEGGDTCIGQPAPSGMMFVIDPSGVHAPSEGMLRSLFGLSKAEARLAVRLALGNSTADCAGKLGISLNTVRTHLKHVLAKTGTNRQGELVRLLLESPAFLEPPKESP